VYLERSGNVIKQKFTTRRETLCNVDHLVVSEKMLRLKAKGNSTLDKERWGTFGMIGRRSIMISW
jgi:hypothetical protein